MKTNKIKSVMVYHGLDIALQITCIDPLTQMYYAGSNTYIPDRNITPTVLKPTLQVFDYKGVPLDNKITTVAWYIGSMQDKDQVSSTIETADFFVRGQDLVIRKNLDEPIRVYLKAQYQNPITKQIITIPKDVEIKVVKSTEVEPAPTVKIDRPDDWILDPTNPNVIQTLNAKIFHNEKSYIGAVEWFKKLGNIKSVIEPDDAIYVSGQSSSALTIDTSKLPDGAYIGCNNLSEADYNKAYGINPDWDSKMSEVFENRNYLQNSELDRNFVLGWIRYEIVGVENLLNKDLIFNYDSEPGFNVDAILTDWDWTGAISVKKNTPFKMSSVKKYLAFTTTAKDKSLSHVKMELGKSTTPYTPAPEDLNFRNILVNGDFRNGVKGWSSSTTKLEPHKVIGFGGNKYMSLDIPYKIDLKTKLYVLFKDVVLDNSISERLNIGIDGNVLSPILKPQSNIKYSLSTLYEAQTLGSVISLTNMYENKDVMQNKVMMLKSCTIMNLTQIFGVGNEPSLEVCDSIFKDMPYIPAPQDYAPDGIIPGEYTTEVPAHVKLPESLDIELNDNIQMVIQGQTEVELSVNAMTNKGPILDPKKFFDIDYYAEDLTAGATAEKIASGNMVKVPIAKVANRNVYADVKPKVRPTTFTKKN